MRLKSFMCFVLVSVIFPIFGQSQIRSGRPLMAGAEGLATLNVGYVYNMYPIGYANPGGDANPTIFIMAKGGIGSSRGLYSATYLYTTDDGHAVFSTPKKIKAFWGTPKSMPRYGCVFNFAGEVLSLWRETKNTLSVARYDKTSNTLVKLSSVEVEGLSRVDWLTACILKDKVVEIDAVYNNHVGYRPKDMGEDESYYDGAGIYRGTIPQGGVKRYFFKGINNISTPEILTDKNFIYAPNSAVRIGDGKDEIYIVTNTLGALSFFDCESDKGKEYVWDNAGALLKHPYHGTYAIRVPLPENPEGVLFVGGEGALMSYTYVGDVENGVCYSSPKELLSEHGALYAGSLCVPNVADWDGDGNDDIIVGNSEGRILFFKNLGSNAAPEFSWKSEQLCSGGKPILIRPGYYGIQGPLEAVWGYVCPTVIDWNGDGLLDIVYSDATARTHVMLNRGKIGHPELSEPEIICIDNMPIWGTWRVKPAVARTGDKTCLINMDEDNALHLYWRIDDFNVRDGGKLRLTDGSVITGHNDMYKKYGNRGRGKFSLYDWDGDGNLDLIIGTPRTSSYPHPHQGLPGGFEPRKDGLQVLIMRNAGTNENMVFEYPVQIQLLGKDLYLGAHSNSPAICSFGDTSDGANLLVGCESGKMVFIDRKDITTITIKERLK